MVRVNAQRRRAANILCLVHSSDAAIVMKDETIAVDKSDSGMYNAMS